LIELKKLKTMKNYSDDEKILFEVQTNNGFEPNIDNMKLKTYIHTSNMVCFTEGNKLRRFENIYELVSYFCEKRLSNV